MKAASQATGSMFYRSFIYTTKNEKAEAAC